MTDNQVTSEEIIVLLWKWNAVYKYYLICNCVFNV